MATHSSVLAWRIPGTGEPGGLPSMGWHKVGHDYYLMPVPLWFVRGQVRCNLVSRAHLPPEGDDPYLKTYT